ncbi:hypothetical protein [Desulfosporosinus metallidurans]|uniref:Uncharacterized protein n=1 Tax=Desulfosporosinus metallidurans TaxID=1888891 RepID=A0A1Q8QX87_9FIRM|nr:hypothetical protein [Desulfosporosinus metallidurans]OLN31890.1 hypothetical protein DSOL_2185 [Desulfosporosinus metallidurans]
MRLALDGGDVLFSALRKKREAEGRFLCFLWPAEHIRRLWLEQDVRG